MNTDAQGLTKLQLRNRKSTLRELVYQRQDLPPQIQDNDDMTSYLQG